MNINYMLTVLSGILVSIMIFLNGKLSVQYSIVFSIIIIHLVGLVVVSFIIWRKKLKLTIKNPKWYLFSGGILSFFAVLFNNYSFEYLNISAIVGLSLFGQMLGSVIIDHYGLFNAKKIKTKKKDILSVLVVFIGITFMVWGTNIVVIPILISVLQGLVIILVRYANGNLARVSNSFTSCFYNNIEAALFAIVVYLLFYFNKTDILSITKINLNEWYIYIGGIIGITTVILSNIIVQKVSAIAMTLILFASQVFASLIIDYIVMGQINTLSIIGGVSAVIGFTLKTVSNKSLQKLTYIFVR